MDASKFLDKELFMKGESDKYNLNIKGKVRGVIIPHHTLASYIMSSFFSSVNKEYKTVIILGPNHWQRGDKIAYTSKNSWDSDFGRIEAEDGKIVTLIQSSDFELDNEILENEHSVAVPINYIRLYMPNAEVVPVVLNETNDLDRINAFTDYLFRVIDNNTLIVASVDFSHYLSETEAVKMDEESIIAIESSDYAKINSFGSSNLDSSTSVIILDKLMKLIEANKLEVLINTNSARITGYNKDVTSYILGIYTTE